MATDTITATITAPQRRTGSAIGVRTPIDTSLCQHRESSARPRRLCVSKQREIQRRTPRTIDLGSPLDVHVVACTRGSDDMPASALILMAGELSARTIDDVVWNSVLEFAAFAHSVVLDLSDVNRVDERGSAMVEALHRVVSGVDGQLSVHGPNWMVEHILRSCGISDQILICHAP